MPVYDFRQLVCWQVAEAFKLEILAFTATAPAVRDFRFCDQIRDSAASAPRNIAEAFGRGRPPEFARYLEFAPGSLHETKAALVDARDRRYVAQKLASRLINLTAATIRVTRRLWTEKVRQADGRPNLRHRSSPHSASRSTSSKRRGSGATRNERISRHSRLE